MNPPLTGQSTNVNSAGVLGEGVTPDIAENGTGVYGRDRAGKGNGVIGYSDNGRGVWGHTKTGFGVLGESVGGRGVVGTSQTDYGIRAHSNSLSGIRSSSDSGAGVEGEALAAGTGVIGTSVSGIGVLGKGGRLAGRFEGAVEVTGNIHLASVDVAGDIRLTNADCAEDFDVEATAAAEPGTVMIIDADGELRPSERAHDKRVAGVISGAGNFKPGIVLDKQESQKAPLTCRTARQGLLQSRCAVRRDCRGRFVDDLVHAWSRDEGRQPDDRFRRSHWQGHAPIERRSRANSDSDCPAIKLSSH